MIYCTSCQRETPIERLFKTAANLENDTEKREKSELSEREEARRETEGKSGRGASEEVRIL